MSQEDYSTVRKSIISTKLNALRFKLVDLQEKLELAERISNLAAIKIFKQEINEVETSIKILNEIFDII